MTDATSEFFDELGRREHEPLLQKATGSLRFDLEHAKGIDHWLVAVKKGDVAVSRKKADADCILRAEKTLFDGVASGEVNAMAAVLRGAIAFEGDPELMVLFQRLFPGPPTRRMRRPRSGPGRRKR